MKSLNFEKLNISESDVLSKLQMKKITGGHDGGGGGTTHCAPSSEVCFDDGAQKYYCSTIWDDGSGSETCCCGHDSGNGNCMAD